MPFYASNSCITWVGFVHKSSRTVNCVCTCVRVKRYFVSCPRVLQRGQCGDGLCEASSTLCKYDRKNGDLFVLSWTSRRRCDLVNDASDVLIEGAVACTNLFIFLALMYMVTAVVCTNFIVLFDVCKYDNFVFGVFVVVECRLFVSGCVGVCVWHVVIFVKLQVCVW